MEAECSLEVWLSGRKRRFAKSVTWQQVRRFESCRLRFLRGFCSGTLGYRPLFPMELGNILADEGTLRRHCRSPCPIRHVPRLFAIPARFCGSFTLTSIRADSKLSR